MAIGGTALVAGPASAGAFVPLRRGVQAAPVPPVQPRARMPAGERVVQGEVLPRTHSHGWTTHDYLYARPGARTNARAVASAREALSMYSRVQAVSRPGRGRGLDDHA